MHAFLSHFFGPYVECVRSILFSNKTSARLRANNLIEWVSSFKYLGYWLTTKLGWRNIISKIRLKTRQRAALVNSFKYSGTSSTQLRRVLFSTFVQPHFTWLFSILPLFTGKQQRDLDHLYFVLLKRIYRCTYWDDFMFSIIYNERTLQDLCFS
jgi:hypothetical protein